MKRIHLAVLGLLTLVSPAQSAPTAIVQKVYTLDDALRLALLNDPRVLSAEQDKIIAAEREREARYLFLPEFGVQASATKYNAMYPFSLSHDFRNIQLFPGGPPYGGTRENIYSGRGYMNMSIFEGGRTVNTLRLASAAAKQANNALEAVKLDLALNVKDIFHKLILAQERMSTAAQYQATAEELLAGTRLDGWDRVEAEAKLDDARSKASEAQHNLELARLSFLKGINVELDTAFSVSGTLDTKMISVDLDKAVLWAMELRPELQSETYRAQMDAISVNLAAARRIPTVFVGGDYELTDERFPLKKTNWDASVGIRIPLSYDFFTQLRQKRAEQRQGQIKRAELQDRVRLEVRQAHSTLDYWQHEWPAREARYKSLQALYDAQSRQGGSSLARLRGLSGLLELKMSYLSAVAEHIVALARLERAVGRALTQ